MQIASGNRHALTEATAEKTANRRFDWGDIAAAATFALSVASPFGAVIAGGNRPPLTEATAETVGFA